MTKGKNIAGVLLALMASDKYTRVINHVFSLKKADDSVFGRLLREGFDSDEFKKVLWFGHTTQIIKKSAYLQAWDVVLKVGVIRY